MFATPEPAANTNPEVVGAVVCMALEAGAGEVLVFDRTCNDPRHCYRRSGIQGTLEGIGDRRVKLSGYHPFLFLIAKNLCHWTFDGRRWRRGRDVPPEPGKLSNSNPRKGAGRSGESINSNISLHIAHGHC